MFNPYQIPPFHYFHPPLPNQPHFWPEILNRIPNSIKNFVYPTLLNNQTHLSTVKVQENLQNQTFKVEDHGLQEYTYLKSSNIQKNNKSKTILKRKRNNQSPNAPIQRNQTKNISKNFGKAILAFAKNNSRFSQQLLKKFGVDRQCLINYIKKARKDLNSLHDLRQMWGADNQNDKLKKCLRIISYNFMRKHCLTYIYNSRIKSVGAHTKYRHRLMQGLQNPGEFLNIKNN